MAVPGGAGRRRPPGRLGEAQDDRVAARRRGGDQGVPECHDLVAIDEIGHLPFSRSGGRPSSHTISKPYETASTMVTTNLASADRPQVFGDARTTTAMLDRPTHPCDMSRPATGAGASEQSLSLARPASHPGLGLGAAAHLQPAPGRAGPPKQGGHLSARQRG